MPRRDYPVGIDASELSTATTTETNAAAVSSTRACIEVSNRLTRSSANATTPPVEV